MFQPDSPSLAMPERIGSMLVIIPGYYFFILVGLYFGYRQKNPDRHPKNLDNGRDLKLAYIINGYSSEML